MKIRHIFVATIAAIAATGGMALAQALPLGMPPGAMATSSDPIRYEPVTGADRLFYEVSRVDRGKTVTVKEADVIRLCGDKDGCEIRMGMHNWDNTQRVASREFLFFYNPINKNWRSSYGDSAGTNADNVIHHPGSEIWACYFTDGEYQSFSSYKDTTLDFGLLSWNQYNADCWMTIID